MTFTNDNNLGIIFDGHSNYCKTRIFRVPLYLATSVTRENNKSRIFEMSCYFSVSLKPGFHYPSWRPELTARVDGWPISITRQHGPCWRVMETVTRQLGPSTRVVETGL